MASSPNWKHIFGSNVKVGLVLCAANSKSLGGSLLNLCRLLNENATWPLSAGIMDFERIQKQKEEKNVLKRGLQVSSTLLEPVVKSVSFGILNGKGFSNYVFHEFLLSDLRGRERRSNRLHPHI